MTDTAMVTKPHMMGMGALLSYRAGLDPDRAALTYGEQTMTRGELDRAANRMARALAGLGVRQDDLVAIQLPGGFAHFIFAFALWKLGATPVPLSAKLPDRELRAVAALLEPRLVIGPAAGALGDIPTLQGGFQPDPALSDAPHPDILAKHLKATMSGGSSGTPKIIVDTGSSAVPVDQTFLLMEIDDLMLHPAPIYHTAGFSQPCLGLVWGIHVVGMTRFDPSEWLRLVQHHHIRWAYLVPTMMSRILALPEAERQAADLSSLRIAIHMAAPCPAWLKLAWIDWVGQDVLWECFASTEGVVGSLISGREYLAHPGSVGIPIRPCRVLDEQGKDCPPGEIGELFGKPGVDGAPGYDYIGAERKARGEWESVGDMGWLDEEGYLYIADRRTDMIISGGANIFPAEIEAVLEAHHAIASSGVVGLPDADFGRVPHAIIELEPGATAPSAQELEAFLSERLARYKLPYSFEFSQAPLRNEVGKMTRSALRAACEARLAAGETFPTLRNRVAVG